VLPHRTRLVLALAAVVAVTALVFGGAAAYAAAAGDAGGDGRRAGETPLTGENAEKARAAALARVPGGTVLRVETDADGAAYEAHVRRPNGTEVTVKFDEQFNVTAVQEGRGGRGNCDERERSDRGQQRGDTDDASSDAGVST
jgi:hypothetical protein